MHTSLAIQSTYDHVEIGLFTDGHKEIIREDKRIASKTIITHIDSILQRNNSSLTDLSYIAVNKGPAPFTSLRVVIATINGISFASHIPLIGIDGLSTYIHEHHNNAWPYTVALFNAFNNDVYFGMELPEKKIDIGCENIEVFLAKLHQHIPNQTIRFIGHGSVVFHNIISNIFGINAYIPESTPQYLSLTYLNTYAQEQQLLGHSSHQVSPLYLKQVHYKTSICM